MNISYNWLKRYIDTDLPAEEIARILTDIGLEVEGFEHIETVRGGLQGVVVGEVLTSVDHPDSDHLHITTVDVGASEPLQIVCGAPNCRAGLKVMCAMVGAALYPLGSDEAMKIKRSKIRGVESQGMLCAEDELGIGVSHAGIMELPPDAKTGTSAKEYFNIQDDYLIAIGLTPNRVDAASHIGVARDLAAYLTSRGKKTTVAMPDVSAFAPDTHDHPIEVQVKNPQAAPRYAGVTVRGCKIAPSPEWMQAALRAVGINPKNNLVDITNFVMFELGQPLHAFDAAKIEGDRIEVRPCADATPFVTLDGVERKLTADDLMICSATRPMCIAGVYGGMDSGIGDATTDVFIESAYFDPVGVRKTARRFGLNTDSSFRFERGADPNIQVYAAKRAALLMKELAGGRIASEVVDIYPAPIADHAFDFSLRRLTALVGKEIPEPTVRTILAALEVRILSESDGGCTGLASKEAGPDASVKSDVGPVWRVAVPPYRVDVRSDVDLVEEVLRIYGYNNVETPTRMRSSIPHTPKPDPLQLKNSVSDYLTANGFSEIMSNSLTRAAYYDDLEAYKAADCVRLLNPLSTDLNVMRQTLLFNMMEAIRLNINHKNADLKLYEFGNVYRYDAAHRAAMREAASKVASAESLPQTGAETAPANTGTPIVGNCANPLTAYSEQYRLAIAVTGLATAPSWNTQPQVASFFTLRAVAEQLLSRFGIDIYALKTETLQSDLFGEALSVELNGKELLQIGAVSRKIRRRMDVKQNVYFLELNFDALVKSTKKLKIAVEDLPKFPEVRRDLALLVDKHVTFSELRAVAFATERKLLKRVALFDVYEGDKLPEGTKSYALSFVLEDKTRTLDEQAIERAMANLMGQFERLCGAQVRS